MSDEVTTVSVVFDGGVFRPDTPLKLEPNTRYVAVIRPEQPEENGAGNVWELLARHAGTVEAPPDWASEHDHYLYDTPKRQDDNE
ncbi:MAG TPA: hypothetical protein VFR15_17190 [Chloroflexia bacterium]|nr:hypothetical protein [Chloroflexia bacterium]